MTTQTPVTTLPPQAGDGQRPAGGERSARVHEAGAPKLTPPAGTPITCGNCAGTGLLYVVRALTLAPVDVCPVCDGHGTWPTDPAAHEHPDPWQVPATEGGARCGTRSVVAGPDSPPF